MAQPNGAPNWPKFSTSVYHNFMLKYNQKILRKRILKLTMDFRQWSRNESKQRASDKSDANSILVPIAVPRGFCHSTHARSDSSLITLRMLRKLDSPRSRDSWRILVPWRRTPFGQQQESRPLAGSYFFEHVQRIRFIPSTNQSSQTWLWACAEWQKVREYLGGRDSCCWPKEARSLARGTRMCKL